MAPARFLAFDLGAESGRAVIGIWDDDRVRLEEIHRFANEPVEVCGTLHWDVLALYNNMLKGMSACARETGGRLEGIGIDTWGVDFGLLARDGTLLQNPVHYRDRRTEDIVETIERAISGKELYGVTGMSLSRIQTLCQLCAMKSAGSPILDAASTFLMMPDLLAYFLSGETVVERTNAINTQFYDPVAGEWWKEALERLGLPAGILPPLADAGTVIGDLLPSVAARTGVSRTAVIAPCTHDTASAVAAAPLEDEEAAFLSCGTWSVVGALSPNSVEGGFEAGLCNEVTLGGRFLCRNIMGLWLLQQARRQWASDGAAPSHDELVHLAASSAGGRTLINPDDPGFLAPEDMCAAIRGFCRDTGQAEPGAPGEIARCILESLALCYRRALEEIAALLGRRFRVLHLVGGGSLNLVLCQFTADATGLPVLAGPAEATVTGNVLVQALARGYLSSVSDVREAVRRSMPARVFTPCLGERWEDLYNRFRQLARRA